LCVLITKSALKKSYKPLKRTSLKVIGSSLTSN
jgi:hypothetical protein